MAPVNFRQGCEGSAADATARLHCAIRVLAVEGGANFMYRMRLDEIATGRQRKVETLLQVKQYGEKIYDACLAQHGDELEKDGSFAVPDSICKLEKADAYTGMQLFNNAVGASK
jgi:hypothetical protein